MSNLNNLGVEAGGSEVLVNLCYIGFEASLKSRILRLFLKKQTFSIQEQHIQFFKKVYFGKMQPHTWRHLGSGFNPQHLETRCHGIHLAQHNSHTKSMQKTEMYGNQATTDQSGPQNRLQLTHGPKPECYRAFKPEKHKHLCQITVASVHQSGSRDRGLS